MGVSGSGKSMIGQALASRLNIPFFDADDFHPLSNIEKMRSGTPLTDVDRFPWLESLAANLRDWEKVVLACSALKESYRQILQSKTDVTWVYLHGTRETILPRMKIRKDHYMGHQMLDSQLETLEEPSYGIKVSIDNDPERILTQIMESLKE